MKLDIVIPTIEKDLPILPRCIESCRKYIPHEISNIFVVGPRTERIINRCKFMNVNFVDEREYMGFGLENMNMRADRRGWVYQQLIKLNGKLGDNDNYIVIDSDKVLLKEHKFIEEDGTPIFYMGDSGNMYVDNILSLIHIDGIDRQSFITDKMVFKKSIIDEIHYALQYVHHVNWIEAIINSYSNNSFHGFSEFEFYGNFYKNLLHYDCKQETNLEVTFNRMVYSLEDCEIMFPEAHAVAFHSLLINNDKLPDK